MRILLASYILFLNISASGQSVEGIWKVLNKKGELQSHVEVYEENGYLYGKCIELFDSAVHRKCKKCRGADQDKSLKGMILFKDCKFDGTKWSEGRILDPKKGRFYDCQISLKNANTLKVRGYLGNPLFGRTLLWYRAK